MSILLATTTIAVHRAGASSDVYDDPGTATVVVTGVEAHIYPLSGAIVLSGQGAQSAVVFRLDCDPCDLQDNDTVIDEQTGQVYAVEWARPQTGMGMDHVMAQLRQVEGEV